MSGWHDDRGAGAEGASIEAPSGVRYGEGCPLPSRPGGLGIVVSSPSGVLGGVPAAIAFHFLHIFGHRTLLVARKIRFSCPKVMVTVTTTYKSGGNKSPSSHRPTKLRLCLFLLEQASVDNKPGLRRIMHDRQAADADALRCRPYEPHSIAV